MDQKIHGLLLHSGLTILYMVQFAADVQSLPTKNIQLAGKEAE